MDMLVEADGIQNFKLNILKYRRKIELKNTLTFETWIFSWIFVESNHEQDVDYHKSLSNYPSTLEHMIESGVRSI